MRKPRLTTKRVIGAALAAGLAVTAVISVATNSQAATTPAATLAPATGAAAGGDTVSVTGKAFQEKDGTVDVKAVTFSSTACGATVAGTAVTASNYNVVSGTKITLTTPALAAGTWFLCIWDAASGSANVLGTGKFVTAAAPTLTSVNGVLESGSATAVSASINGGAALTFVGTNFSKKAQVYVAGVKAATTYVSATSLKAVVPAGNAGTGKAVKVSTEYGSVTSAKSTVTYNNVISISPSFAKAGVQSGITVTGKGFNDMTFGSAAGNWTIAVVDATVSLDPTTPDPVPTTGLCTNVVVDKDTSLSCKLPASLSGAYMVVLIQRDASTATDIGSVTANSRGAVLAAADF